MKTRRYHHDLLRFLAIGIGILASSSLRAFDSNGRWTSTATDQPTAPAGNPITLTWSIVPDGTMISHLAKPSNLVAFFDGIFEVEEGGTDFQQRPWFELVEGSFQRWSDLSGVVFQYEEFDDGLSNRSHGLWPGVPNVRGDVRLGGAYVDGVGGTYGQAGFIPNADLTLDTSDVTRFGDTTDYYYNLRQTLMHEVGHSLGLSHNEALGAFVLMHPFAQVLFDGPQFDDIRGAHHLYGDAYEKGTLNGNGSPTDGTPLGVIGIGTSREVGADVPFSTSALSPTLSDFASISNSDDIDFWKFTIDDYSVADFELTPGGFLYQEKGANDQQLRRSMPGCRVILLSLCIPSPMVRQRC